MLDLVLPDQHEHCEVGIELMLIAGCFKPERASSSAHSLTDLGPLKPKSPGFHKPLRWDSSRAPCLQDDGLDKMLESHCKQMVEFAKWHNKLKPTLCHSGSALGMAP